MGMFLKNFGVGGGRPPDLRNFLQDGLSGKPLVCIGDLGDNPQDQGYPWRIPPQGDPPYSRNAVEAIYCRAV